MAPHSLTTATALVARSDSELSQAAIGGILGSVVAFVAIVIGIWLCVTHGDSYREFTGRTRRRRRRHSYYESSTGYDDNTTETSSTTEATVQTQPGGYRVRVTTTEGVTGGGAPAAAPAGAPAGFRPTPNIVEGEGYVLNTPPLRFPPTAVPAGYRQTAYPQFPGTNRFP